MGKTVEFPYLLSFIAGLEMREHMKWHQVISIKQGNCILLKLQRKRCNQTTARFVKMGIIIRMTVFNRAANLPN